MTRRTLALLCLVAAVAAACGAMLPQSDVTVYEHYARAMSHGSLSLGLPKEYPALAGVFFLAAAKLPVPFAVAWECCMAIALAILLTVGVRLLRGDAWARRLLTYLALGAGTVMFTRFDLLPAVCVVLAIGCIRRDRFGWAWIAAGAGAALKVFPALLLPGFFIYEWRRTGRRPWRKLTGTALAAIGGAMIQSAIAPGTFLEPIRYEAQRGFEISSIPGSLTLLSAPLHLHWQYAFGAWQVDGPGHAIIAYTAVALEVVLILAVWTCLARDRLTVEAGALAVLTVAVLSDKALAPQYLIWLAPLWALWPMRRGWLAVSVLTFLTYPVAAAFDSGPGPLLPSSVALVRNLVLICATALWIRQELRESSPLASFGSTTGAERRMTSLAGEPLTGLAVLFEWKVPV